MTWMIALVAVLIALLIVGLRVRFWLAEGRKMQESGYLPPAPSIFAKLFWAISTRVLGFLLVGPIRVIGRENLTVKGRKVFVPNHTYELDFDLVAVATRTSFRYMTSTAELRGLRGAFGAWTGAIPVNTKVQGGGEAALNASVEAIQESYSNNFLIFPQAGLRDCLKRDEFKTGFARLAYSVYAETGAPCFVIPMALLYLREPQHKTWSHLFFSRLRRLFGKTTYGAVVVIGEAISAQDLPEDPNAATDIVFERIRTLLAQAHDTTKSQQVAY